MNNQIHSTLREILNAIEYESEAIRTDDDDSLKSIREILEIQTESIYIPYLRQNAKLEATIESEENELQAEENRREANAETRRQTEALEAIVANTETIADALKKGGGFGKGDDDKDDASGGLFSSIAGAAGAGAIGGAAAGMGGKFASKFPKLIKAVTLARFLAPAALPVAVASAIGYGVYQWAQERNIKNLEDFQNVLKSDWANMIDNMESFISGSAEDRSVKLEEGAAALDESASGMQGDADALKWKQRQEIGQAFQNWKGESQPITMAEQNQGTGLTGSGNSVVTQTPKTDKKSAVAPTFITATKRGMAADLHTAIKPNKNIQPEDVRQPMSAAANKEIIRQNILSTSSPMGQEINLPRSAIVYKKMIASQKAHTDASMYAIHNNPYYAELSADDDYHTAMEPKVISPFIGPPALTTGVTENYIERHNLNRRTNIRSTNNTRSQDSNKTSNRTSNQNFTNIGRPGVMRTQSAANQSNMPSIPQLVDDMDMQLPIIVGTPDNTFIRSINNARRQDSNKTSNRTSNQNFTNIGRPGVMRTQRVKDQSSAMSIPQLVDDMGMTLPIIVTTPDGTFIKSTNNILSTNNRSQNFTNIGRPGVMNSTVQAAAAPQMALPVIATQLEQNTTIIQKAGEAIEVATSFFKKLFTSEETNTTLNTQQHSTSSNSVFDRQLHRIANNLRYTTTNSIDRSLSKSVVNSASRNHDLTQQFADIWAPGKTNVTIKIKADEDAVSTSQQLLETAQQIEMTNNNYVQDNRSNGRPGAASNNNVINADNSTQTQVVNNTYNSVNNVSMGGGRPGDPSPLEFTVY